MKIRRRISESTTEEIDMQLTGVLAGSRLESVILTGRDFENLIGMDDERLRDWVGHLSTRFPPEV